ncbi:hypothetical protein LEP1GSC199_2722 [Leptospira vanthielii serovar Holland str. Waz Holland = ATCC 700522]|uniref:Uncharacterized protein n=1 Tax=Leptospira vanthielii serovar Holland str. Waz Holland = ATCC 700522 TaxID=1218591 RepID=N1W208_9LEPT|nr:hypothetical protein LEP1GSC199_2722 [Leptospira vanthielii serovar Holland str. Waz Holland = ATCC 700522]
MTEPCPIVEAKKEPNNICKLIGVMDWQDTERMEKKRKTMEIQILNMISFCPLKASN